jgi:hypothetical protein
MNLFRYSGDDPVDGSDPLGLTADKIYLGGWTEWAQNYNSPADTITMAAHGNVINGAVTVVDGKSKDIISAATIAKDAIKAGFGNSCNKAQLAICESGVGGDKSLGQKVANELAARTGVKPDVSAPDGDTANPSSVNRSTGVVTSGPLESVPDPDKKFSGKILHFTAEPKTKTKDK